MQTLLYGTIRLSENQKIGKFAVYSSGGDHKKVGSLLMDIKKNKTDYDYKKYFRHSKST